MIILGIETSCDETSAAVLQKEGERVQILSNIIASSASLQAKYGGVVPEQAAREQLKSIIPVIQEALSQAFPHQKPFTINNIPAIDAIAVTQGPGLIGSLLVGVETAKVLATVWNKPLVPVHHLLGHFYANWIETGKPEKSEQSEAGKSDNYDSSDDSDHSETPHFPCIGLLVSGGHTDLVLFKDHGKFEYLGGTRDDAAGECFDKCARLLGLPYPGGPVISKLAEQGDPQAYKLPRPMINSKDFDFSFSGLKTAVANLINQKAGWPDKSQPKVGHPLDEENQNAGTPETTSDHSDTPISSDLSDICASIEEAIIDVLVKKTIAAAQKYGVEQIIVAGGVAANRKLSKKIITEAQNKISRARVFIPPPQLCTDNAAYIATAAFFNYQPVGPLTLQANPSLSLSSSSN